MPVRLGSPLYDGGLSEVVHNPIYATGIGLIQFGRNNQGVVQREPDKSGRLNTIFKRMKSWFKGSF